LLIEKAGIVATPGNGFEKRRGIHPDGPHRGRIEVKEAINAETDSILRNDP